MNAAAPASTRSPDREHEVQAECVRTLYEQIPNSLAAALGVTVYLTITLWRHAPHRLIGYFLAIQAVSQLHRLWVMFSYRRATLSVHNAGLWARRYAHYMLGAGLVWGIAAVLFLHAQDPLSLVFTLCGLYGITGGAVSGNAYHPPAYSAFVIPIFGAAFVRLAAHGTVEHIALGVASLFYAGILLLFCRVQARSIRQSIQIRFENADLVQRLQEANLAKSRFLAAASHDLRQPLHALSLFSASLRELKLDEQQKRVVDQIYRNIDSLESLFDELLDISKLDAGYFQPRLADFRVQHLLDSLERHYAPLAQEKALSLRIKPCSATLRSDPALLERVLGNLVANAIRYTSEGGVIVASRRRQERLELVVWDTGIGIPPDQHERIFEEFFQLGNPERDRRKGLGLGLPIARRIARLLGSELTLASRPGRGSRFWLQVPLGDAAAVSSRRPEPEQAGDALSGRCVVVVEDEQTIRDGMHELLSSWGCTPVEAASAAAAITLLQERALEPQLVLADYRLTDGAVGSDAVDQLRARFGRELPALLITGDTAPERLREAKQSGLHILHKPVRPAQLRALCNYLLTRAP
ncbi:MAG TPA: hybrid sensor histidine kinase/response regulator [Polyangiaceae bacterium]|nr:hybrid sensor histidine kinase/response regulator [Polyangiaceae bacterium]